MTEKGRGVDPIDVWDRWDAEDWAARVAFAHSRLDSLDRVFRLLGEADLYDAVYEIWSDFIEGHEPCQQIEPSKARERDVARVLARIVQHVESREARDFARIAWGDTVAKIHGVGFLVYWVPELNLLHVSRTYTGGILVSARFTPRQDRPEVSVLFVPWLTRVFRRREVQRLEAAAAQTRRLAGSVA